MAAKSIKIGALQEIWQCRCTCGLGQDVTPKSLSHFLCNVVYVSLVPPIRLMLFLIHTAYVARRPSQKNLRLLLCSDLRAGMGPTQGPANG